MSLPLEGIKVIDAASYLAGPGAATVLADFGADVVKIEPPQGDGYRLLHGVYPVDYNWLLTSRNKRSLALDLGKAEAQAVLHDLIRDADVLLNNFRPDQLERYDLTWERIHALNPRLIYAHISGYGTRGAEAERRAFDSTAWWSRTGILDLCHHHDGSGPAMPAGGVGDHATGMALFGAIVLGLYDRERTGEGRRVTTSLAANGAWSNGMHLQATIAGYDVSALLAEKGRFNPFANVYRTSDDRFVLITVTDLVKEWPRVTAALGHDEWLEDPRYREFRARLKHRPELLEDMKAAILGMTIDEVSRRLDEYEIAYSRVATTGEAVDDAQLAANDIVVRTGLNEPGYDRTISSPINMDGVDKRPPSVAPGVGEHSRDVLRELGLDDAQIDRLIDAGVVHVSD